MTQQQTAPVTILQTHALRRGTASLCIYHQDGAYYVGQCIRDLGHAWPLDAAMFWTYEAAEGRFYEELRQDIY